MFNQLRTTKKIEKKIVLAENDVYLHINKRTFIDSIQTFIKCYVSDNYFLINLFLKITHEKLHDRLLSRKIILFSSI